MADFLNSLFKIAWPSFPLGFISSFRFSPKITKNCKNEAYFKAIFKLVESISWNSRSHFWLTSFIRPCSPDDMIETCSHLRKCSTYRIRLQLLFCHLVRRFWNCWTILELLRKWGWSFHRHVLVMTVYIFSFKTTVILSHLGVLFQVYLLKWWNSYNFKSSWHIKINNWNT